ncbi:MAG: 16S rRNA processing protein RimM [Ruminococcaceae bacterium]|nr:16S rRNA processing protein RimM [Oscillospiraceae bacterium]
MLEYFTIGKIVNTHGVRGELKVIPETDDPGRFSKLKTVRVKLRNNVTEYEVERARGQGTFILLKLKGIDTPEQGMLLKNSLLEVHRKDAIKLPEGMWFIGDLIGCSVFEDDGNCLGKVINVLQTGSNDVYEVTDDQGRTILIPALKTVVLDVNIEEAVIKVKLLPGLKEIYYEN